MRFMPIPGVRVIGISGKARHGKDTAAKAMLEARPDAVTRFAFADGVKLLARLEHEMTTKDARLLQRLGAEARRFDPLKWIKAVYWTLDEVRPAIAVISDVRHRNEADFVRTLGGALIRVCRRKADGTPYLDPSRDPAHLSETDLDDWPWWDVTIEASNPDTVSQRARQVLHQLEHA